MDFAGISDTLTVIPVVKDDSSNIISVGVNVDSISGPDILVTKLDSGGSVEWQHTYSSAGFNRDQAIAVAVDDKCSIYVAGVLYSSATNFDWVILKYGYDGTLAWTYTLNGTANNYDAPAAIKIKNSFVYVTGEVYDSVTQLNYATIQLNRTTGALNWKREYDFNSLFDIAFAMDISCTSTGIKVAGASQDNLTKWNYCSISYDSMGVANDTTRIVGTNNSFDRPMAARGDVFGNFYITGAASDSGASFNVRTAKIDSAGNLAWVADFGSNGKDDEGNDIIVDDSGYIYVCGKSNSMTAIQQDVVLIKYSNNGSKQYHRMFDADSAADEAYKMCFDNYGNIVMTGTGTRENADILTLAYNRAGDFLWKIFFNGDYDGQDKGTGIISDAYGNIFVTGEVQITDTTWQQVTIKYKTDYFLVPQDTVPAPSSLLFYPNSGQIIDTHDSVRYDVAFYTINQFPKLYFHQDSISFVMAHVDSDTATTDTLEKITMNFAEGNMANCDPYTSNTHDTDQVLNYFLGHCPDGITGITGSEKIMYSNVYENTDIIFSNNNAGMKFQIIMNPGAEPQAVLHFTGHQSLQLVNNADLQVSGVLGSFIYERPLVYQLDYFGTRISLGWLASYHISGDDVGFILSGNYDNRLPLVVECAKSLSCPAGTSPIANLAYSMYMGGSGNDVMNAIASFQSYNIYITGASTSSVLPFITGTNLNTNVFEAFVFKMDATSNEVYWGTFYGGSLNDIATDLDIDNDNNVYIVGTSSSLNLPQSITTAFVSINPLHGPGYWGGELHGLNDLFIAKIDGSTSISGGHIMWADYIGSSEGEVGPAISIDNYGTSEIYMSGNTFGSDFPTFSSCSGSGYNQPWNHSLTTNEREGVILKFDQSGTPCWGTYFGTVDDDNISDIQVVHDDIDGTFRLYIDGFTTSSSYDLSYPCTTAVFTGGFPQCSTDGTVYSHASGANIDAFIAKFDDNLALRWSTFIGGTGNDEPGIHSLAGYGSAIYMSVASVASGGFPSFPTCTGCYNQQTSPSTNDGFIARFGNGVLAWETFWGGNGSESINSIYTKDFYLYIAGNSSAQTYASSTFCDVPIMGEYPLCPSIDYYYESTVNPNSAAPDIEDAFIAKFNSSNELIWSTFIGGNKIDFATDITKKGYALYLIGSTHSACINNSAEDFPQIALPSPAYFQLGNASNAACLNCHDGFISKFDLSPPVGINEFDKIKGLLSLYPNPTHETLSISLNTKESGTYYVLDILGNQIISGKINNSSNSCTILDLSNYSPGVYVLEIVCDKFTLSEKIVKQ